VHDENITNVLGGNSLRPWPTSQNFFSYLVYSGLILAD
jgi:hypothetical protein